MSEMQMRIELARELAELDRAKRHYLRGRGNLRDTLVSNLPAILRALCVQAAVEEETLALAVLPIINARADELLAELSK